MNNGAIDALIWLQGGSLRWTCCRNQQKFSLSPFFGRCWLGKALDTQVFWNKLSVVCTFNDVKASNTIFTGYGEGFTDIIYKGKMEERKFLAFYIKWATLDAYCAGQHQLTDPLNECVLWLAEARRWWLRPAWCSTLRWLGWRKWWLLARPWQRLRPSECLICGHQEWLSWDPKSNLERRSVVLVLSSP